MFTTLRSRPLMLAAVATATIAAAAALSVTAVASADETAAPRAAAVTSAEASAPVQALGGCTVGIICGKVSNNSNRSIMIANNWCHTGEGYSGETMGCPNTTERWLSATHSSTVVWRDTDAWRAPGGCITRLVTGHDPRAGHVDIDRRGRGSQWHRVHNNEVHKVSFIRC